MALVQGRGLTEGGLLPEMAMPFAGGFGGTHGLACGALSGALLALGIACASVQMAREETYRLAAQLVHDFERRFGTAQCCELVGLDPKNDDWAERYQSRQAHTTICWPCVEFAVCCGWEATEGRTPHV